MSIPGTTQLDPLAVLLPLFILAVAAAGGLAVLKERFPSLHPASIGRRLLARSRVVLLVGLACAATLWLLRVGRADAVLVEVDMKVSTGDVAELRVNDVGLPPSQARLVLNSRQIYRFERPPGSIFMLRLDPTDAAHAAVSICEVRVKVGELVVRRFGPEEIRGWSAGNLVGAGGDSGCLSFQTTTNDPSLMTSTSILAARGPGWLSYLPRRLRQPDWFSIAFVAGFFLFLLSGLRRRVGLVEAAVVAGTALLAYPVALLVMRLPGPPPPVRSAVGMAAYLGYPKFHDYLAALAVLACSIGVGWLAFRLAPAPADTPEPDRQRPASARRRALLFTLHLVVLLLLLALFQPDLPAEARQLAQESFASPNWDEQNLWVWSYLVSAGLKPFRDFWHPYSGFYLHQKPFPVGQVAAGLEATALVWFFYVAVFQLTGKRVRRSLFLLFLLALPLRAGVIPGWHRYLLAIDLVLSYLAVSQSKRFQWSRHVPLALVAGLVFFYEPTQFLYAGAGMVVHTVLVAVPPRATPAKFRRLGQDLAAMLGRRALNAGLPVLAGLSVVVAWLAWVGLLPGFLAYQMSTRAISEYSAWPSPVASWVAPLLRRESVFLLLFLLIALAAYRWFSARQETDPVTMALLALGAAGFLCFQRQIVRPHSMEVVQLYPYAGALLYGLLVWPRRTAAQSAIIGCFAGWLLAIGVDRGTVGSAARALAHATQTAAGNYQVLAGRGPRVGALDRFSPGRLSGFVEENAVIRLLRERYGLNRGQTVFVLGDAPIFYVLLAQDAPYVINNYNGSPIQEQQKTVDWLQRRRPQFAVWDPAKTSYDSVPHLVRVPLIYGYVVQHYGFLASVGRFHVLSVLPPGAAPDFSYWVRTLGSVVDLGHVPRVARSSDHPACREPANECGDVLLVRFEGAYPRTDKKAAVFLETRAGPMTLQFHLVRGVREYVINLERLWFWGIAGPDSPHVMLPEAGAEVRIERRRRDAAVLY